MPSLSEATNTPLHGYARMEPGQYERAAPPTSHVEPGRSPFMRCPLPPIWQSSPDSLRQFYHNSSVPQVRLFNPQPAPILTPVSTRAASGSGVVSSTTTTTSTTTTASATAVAQIAATSVLATLASRTNIKQAALNTTSIGPSAKYIGQIVMSKAFQLFELTSSAPCRIQLYGTALAQSGDLSRGLDVAPAAGTSQNIIADIVLDTTPLQWTFQDRVGANGDTPQTTITYITITNLDITSNVITATLVYATLAS